MVIFMVLLLDKISKIPLMTPFRGRKEIRREQRVEPWKEARKRGRIEKVRKIRDEKKTNRVAKWDWEVVGWKCGRRHERGRIGRKKR